MKSENLPKISVIIPVHNTEPWLRRCLDSVVNQSMRDIEIICVNDASTDNSLEILQEYERIDNRIKIIDFKTNNGECAAKNAGIDAASGEYVGFVDSDDCIDPDYYEKLYSVAEMTNAEIVRGGLTVIAISGEKIVRDIKEKTFSSHTAAIYSKKMIIEKTLNFPVGIIDGGDLVFLLKALCSASKIKMVDHIYYYYIKRHGSISIMLTHKGFLSSFKAAELKFEYLNNFDVLVDDYDYFYYEVYCKRVMRMYLRTNDVSNIRLCAEAALKHYNKCKRPEVFDAKLMIDYPKWYILLHSGDIDGIIDYMVYKNTPAKMFAADIRARLQS